MREYVIVDLEMCKVPKPMRTEKYHWSSETIQIGAVLVNENLEIIDEFNSYVHPEYGSIDDYIALAYQIHHILIYHQQSYYLLYYHL